ncbi:histone-lysine N-methyltransferase SETMAR [Trichonephila clavipes]|nr:histone-lysine N-methyltransferase SETMAR [Trichonephila clavipes]
MPRQIKDELDSVYGDSAPSFTTVKFSAAEFKGGRKSLRDDERSRRPNTATTEHRQISSNGAWGLLNYSDHEVILIDYLQKGKTITGAYYASLLDKLKADLAEKRSHMQEKKILFHQDNALPHTSVVAMAKIHELRF